MTSSLSAQVKHCLCVWQGQSDQSQSVICPHPIWAVLLAVLPLSLLHLQGGVSVLSYRHLVRGEDPNTVCERYWSLRHIDASCPLSSLSIPSQSHSKRLSLCAICRHFFQRHPRNNQWQRWGFPPSLSLSLRWTLRLGLLQIRYLVLLMLPLR